MTFQFPSGVTEDLGPQPYPVPQNLVLQEREEGWMQIHTPKTQEGDFGNIFWGKIIKVYQDPKTRNV